MKALKLAPLKLLELIAEIPTARFLEVMVSEGPSNSIFCTNLSMVLSALKEDIQRKPNCFIDLKQRRPSVLQYSDLVFKCSVLV